MREDDGRRSNRDRPICLTNAKRLSGELQKFSKEVRKLIEKIKDKIEDFEIWVEFDLFNDKRVEWLKTHKPPMWLSGVISLLSIIVSVIAILLSAGKL